MKPAIWLLPAVVAAAANCSSLHYDTPGQIPGTADSPGFDGGATVPNARGKATQAGSRQVCRGGTMPRGWIAVDYISSSGSCRNSMRDGGANTAVIVRYTTLPPETILIVCSDQHLPYQWARLPEEATDASSTQCPRKPGDTRTGLTIVRIRRSPS